MASRVKAENTHLYRGRVQRDSPPSLRTLDSTRIPLRGENGAANVSAVRKHGSTKEGGPWTTEDVREMDGESVREACTMVRREGAGGEERDGTGG